MKLLIFLLLTLSINAQVTSEKYHEIAWGISKQELKQWIVEAYGSNVKFNKVVYRSPIHDPDRPGENYEIQIGQKNIFFCLTTNNLFSRVIVDEEFIETAEDNKAADKIKEIKEIYNAIDGWDVETLPGSICLCAYINDIDIWIDVFITFYEEDLTIFTTFKTVYSVYKYYPKKSYKTCWQKMTQEK